jgi:hypothetical protein
MDAMVNLKEQLELANEIVSITGAGGTHIDVETADRLAELVLALDEWRRNGGFDPYSAA